MSQSRHARTALVGLLALLGLALAACGTDSPKAGAKPSVGVELFGSKKALPPGPLAKVRPSMTRAEVEALFPETGPKPDPIGNPSLSIDSGYAGVTYEITFYPDRDSVGVVSVLVRKDVAEALETVWGPPDEPNTWPQWTSNEAGYSASYTQIGQRTMRVDFRPIRT